MCITKNAEASDFYSENRVLLNSIIDSIKGYSRIYDVNSANIVIAKDGEIYLYFIYLKDGRKDNITIDEFDDNIKSTIKEYFKK